MKQILLFIFIFLHLHSYSQQKDRRKYIGDELNTKSFTVSPSGQICVFNYANELYFSESIDSSWKVKHLLVAKDTNRLEYFFNDINLSINKKFLLTNYCLEDQEYPSKLGLLLSKDNGENWEKINIPKNHTILKFSIDSNGIIECFSLLRNKLKTLKSVDFGRSWKIKNILFNKHFSTFKEYHNKTEQGILLFDNNKIYVTKNKWKTKCKLTTKGIFNDVDEDPFYSFLVEKIKIYKNQYVMLYADRIFFSKMDKIEWKSLNYEIASFDSDDSKLYAVTMNAELLAFENLDFNEPEKLTNYNRKYEIEYIEIFNNELYLLQNDATVYKYSNGFNSELGPYTSDKNIPNFGSYSSGDKIRCSVENNEIYISEDEGKSWYREAIVKDFFIIDYNVNSDSLITFWTDLASYQEYSLKTHSFKPIKYAFQLDSFLKFPIETFDFSYYKSYKSYSKMHCQKKDSLTLYCSCEMEHDKVNLKVTKEIDLRMLYNQLHRINNNSYIKSRFPFTENDYNDYTNKINRHQNDEMIRISKKNAEFLLSLPKNYKNYIDTFNTNWISQLEFNLNITLINSNQDTLNLLNDRSLQYIYYKESSQAEIYQNLLLEDGIFLYYIFNCFPSEFREKMEFTNSDIIYKWANKIWFKKKIVKYVFKN